MGARRSGSRISIVVLAILAFTLIAAGAVLIATGRLCITSSHRPADRYEGASPTTYADPVVMVDPAATVDADSDGIPDNDDVLAAALSYIQTRPHYKSVYYPSGYPDDEHGVCADWLSSRAGRRATTFRRSLRPTLRGVQRPMRLGFRIRRSISAARPISRSFSMLMRSAWQTTPMKSPNGAAGTSSCMRGTLGLSPTVAMNAAFRISFIIPDRFSCAMRRTS